jgi:hypothetical protein
LGLLPVASALAAALGTRDPGGVTLSLSLFGLVITVAVVTYHTRNDELYDTLIARAAAIERSLELPDGGYANRPRSWLDLRMGSWVWKISHGQGVSTVYTATSALWIYLALRAAFRSADLFVGRPAIHAWLGIAVTAALLAAVLRGIKRQHDARADLLRRNIRIAVAALMAVDNDLGRIKNDETFILACAVAADRTAQQIAAEISFYADLGPEALSYYVHPSSGLQRSAFLAALLTSLPPPWIFDISSGRRAIS